MPDDLNFDRAQYTAPPEVLPPAPEYYRANADSNDSAAFTKAILFGLGAAIVASILYAALTIATHIEIGYAALGVGYLIGKAMLAGSAQRGGRNYQIAAVILTYLSVSMAAVPEILWGIHKDGTDISRINTHGVMFLARYGVASPFLRLSEGVGGFISLFILFIGIRAAWRLTSASASSASHPFATS